MIKVGLTGGIGSGKTTVAAMFSALGVPVYYADEEAKALMNRSKIIRRKLTALLGPEAYKNNKINRAFIANKVFNNKSLLAEVNAIVHPKVASHFMRWCKKQNAPYIIQEAAILFENGRYKKFDQMLLVVADEEERIKRVIKRDETTRKKVNAVIENQWKDAEKIELSDFVIANHDLDKTQKQVLEIHQKILLSAQ